MCSARKDLAGFHRRMGRQGFECLHRQTVGVAQALKSGWSQQRFFHLLAQALLESDQAAEQIAAVHGGDVRRLQRAEAAGVVPVVKCPWCRSSRSSVPNVFSSRREHCSQTDIAELVGGQRRKQYRPMFGWRGAMGEVALGVFLDNCPGGAGYPRRRRRSQRSSRSCGQCGVTSWRCGEVNGAFGGLRGRLTRYATSGEASHSPGRARRQSLRCGRFRLTRTANPAARRHCSATSSHESGISPQPSGCRGGSRRLPFQQVAARADKYVTMSAPWHPSDGGLLVEQEDQRSGTPARRSREHCGETRAARRAAPNCSKKLRSRRSGESTASQ